MAKMTKLQRSNSAHKRLIVKHKSQATSLAGNARATAIIKADYHDDVILWQDNLQRVLTFDDKKYLYDIAEKRYKRKQALNEQFNKK